MASSRQQQQRCGGGTSGAATAAMGDCAADRWTAMFWQVNEAMAAIARRNNVAPYELRSKYVSWTARLHVLHDDELPASPRPPAAVASDKADTAAATVGHRHYSCDLDAAMDGALPCGDDDDAEGAKRRRPVAASTVHGASRAHQHHRDRARDYGGTGTSSGRPMAAAAGGGTAFCKQYDPDPNCEYTMLCTWPVRGDKIVLVRTDTRRINIDSRHVLAMAQVRRGQLAHRLPVVVNTQLQPAEENRPGETCALCRGFVFDWSESSPVLVRVFLVDLGRLTLEAHELSALRCLPPPYDIPPLHFTTYLLRDSNKRALKHYVSELHEKLSTRPTVETERTFESLLIERAAPAGAQCRVKMQPAAKPVGGKEPKFPLLSLKVSTDGGAHFVEFNKRCQMAVHEWDAVDGRRANGDAPVGDAGADRSTQKSTPSDDVVEYSSHTQRDTATAASEGGRANGNGNGGPQTDDDTQLSSPRPHTDPAARQHADTEGGYLNVDDLRLAHYDKDDRMLDLFTWVQQSNPEQKVDESDGSVATSAK